MPNLFCFVSSHGQSKLPQLHGTPLTEAGSLPSGAVMLSSPSSSTLNPADSSCDRSGFRFPYTAALPAVDWHRMRSPGLGTSHFHNVPSPTPRCEQMVLISVDPHLLPAFPRRRYGRLTQRRMTRLIRVHRYYGPLLCILRSRSLELSAHAFNPTSC